jgi:hypothetical protein
VMPRGMAPARDVFMLPVMLAGTMWYCSSCKKRQEQGVFESSGSGSGVQGQECPVCIVLCNDWAGIAGMLLS